MAPPSTSTSYSADPAENYHRHFEPAIGQPVADRLLAAAAPRQRERVLDLACGTGVVTRALADIVGPDGRVVGLDAHPGMVAVARANAPDTIRWVVAPAEDIPLDDASHDLVVCSMGVQFFGDRPTALGQVRRVLVPGGRFAWCTPGPTPPLFQAYDRALRSVAGPGASMFIHAVFNLHDPAQAQDLMDSAGFTEVTVESSPVALRLGPPAEFFWHYAMSTPLAGVVASLDPEGREALDTAIAAECASLPPGDDQDLAPRLTTVTGRRP